MLHMTPALLDTSGLRADSSSVLADLSSDSLIRLRMSVSEFRSSGRRLIGELYVMTQQLCVMQEILGDNFRSFVQSELDLGNRMISRYMHINKVLKTHFSHNGQVDLSEANAFTQRALALLSPTTDSHVVDELRVIASQGKNIDHHVVMEAMNKAEADAVAQLASAQADLTAKTRQLEDEQRQREVERARNQREQESQAEMIRRGEQRRSDLEEQIQKLHSQETQVRFETKEVLPEGFVSAEEAINEKNRELALLVTQRDEVSLEIQGLTDQQKKLQEAIQETTAGTSQFLAMKEQADTLIAQFPIALLKSLSEKDKTVRDAIASLGETFVLFGQHLAKAGA